MVSTDLGNSWVHTGNNLAGIVYSLVGSNLTSGLFYAGTSQGLFKSTDGGVNWIRLGSFTNVRTVAVDRSNDSIIYAGTSSGVYVSTDGGSNWQASNEGLISTDILCLAFRSGLPRTVFAGTNGAGVFVTTPPTGVVNDPRVGARGGAWIKVGSNPCNRVLRITVQSAVVKPIRGGVYDHSGRLVFTLEPKLAVQGTADWQIKSGVLPAGVYFVRLQCGVEEVTGRVILLN